MFLAVKAAENRFERRPWAAWLIVVGFILAVTEFGLRIAAPTYSSSPTTFDKSIATTTVGIRTRVQFEN